MASHRDGDRQTIAACLLGSTKSRGEPRHSVHRGSLVLGGPPTDSSSVPGGRLAAKAAPEPNTYRCNLRSRKSHELGPIGPNMRARGSPRPRLRILAERASLIAQEASPRLGWPSAWCMHITRDGGLGDAETEHQKLTMDPWRTPDKVLTGHPGNQTANPTGNPWAPTSPATTRSISRNREPAVTVPAQDGFRLDDHQT